MSSNLKTMWWATCVIAVMLAAADVSSSRAGERPLNAPATADEIASLVRNLSDPDYKTRTYATRRLCGVGMAAYESLQRAADGADAESALRARRLITTLDALRFAGTEVSIAFSKPNIDWHDEVDLRITIFNRSAYPAKIPFEMQPPEGDESDATQVGVMLDTAEWLYVKGPSGSEVELRLDDILMDEAVGEAVQDRLAAGPHRTLAPGERVTIVVRAFNRGWARFPLLDHGKYTAILDYTPRWQDSALKDAKIGRVLSNAAEITVDEAAPAAVSRHGVEADVVIEVDADVLVARLTNRTDHALFVNTNFGHSLPFAEGHWNFESSKTQRKASIATQANASWEQFDPARLVEVAPGDAIELTRTKLADVKKMLTQAGVPNPSEGGFIYFGYSNRCDRRWQAREGQALIADPKAPSVLRNPLPRRMLSTRQTSNRLAAEILR